MWICTSPPHWEYAGFRDPTSKLLRTLTPIQLPQEFMCTHICMQLEENITLTGGADLYLPSPLNCVTPHPSYSGFWPHPIAIGIHVYTYMHACKFTYNLSIMEWGSKHESGRGQNSLDFTWWINKFWTLVRGSQHFFTSYWATCWSQYILSIR